MPKPPTWLAVVEGEVRLAGVFDQREVVRLGQRHEAVEIRRVAIEMHRHDRLRARRDGALNGVWVEVIRDGVNVYEDRAGACQQHDVRGGGEAERRGDDLIARADAMRQQRDVQRRRACGDRDGLAHAGHLSEPALERRDTLALRELPRRERITHGVEVFLGNLWLCDRNHVVSSICARRPRKRRPCA